MNFESYLNIVKETYDKYKTACEPMYYIDINLLPDNNDKERLKEYIDYLGEKNNNLETEISNISEGDKSNLDKMRKKFYDIQREVNELRSTGLELEKDIYAKKAHIDNSLL